jgi:hypothetical protein
VPRLRPVLALWTEPGWAMGHRWPWVAAWVPWWHPRHTYFLRSRRWLSPRQAAGHRWPRWGHAIGFGAAALRVGADGAARSPG